MPTPSLPGAGGVSQAHRAGFFTFKGRPRGPAPPGHLRMPMAGMHKALGKKLLHVLPTGGDCAAGTLHTQGQHGSSGISALWQLSRVTCQLPPHASPLHPAHSKAPWARLHPRPCTAPEMGAWEPAVSCPHHHLGQGVCRLREAKCCLGSLPVYTFLEGHRGIGKGPTATLAQGDSLKIECGWVIPFRPFTQSHASGRRS